MKNIIRKNLNGSRLAHLRTLGVVAAVLALPAEAMAQTGAQSAKPPSEINLNIPAGAAVPSQVNPTATGGLPAKTMSANPDVARIDALRFRAIVGSPSVTDTVLGDTGGWRGKLADYGIGVNGLLSGTFTFNTMNQPQQTYGATRYVGQTPEFDSSNDYLALTYDLGHAGVQGGLLTLMGCTSASTNGTYPHGVRICQAYLDQQLFNNHFDIQIGYLENSFQYTNTYVGGSLASGTLGPNATLPTEMGFSGAGDGAPAVNLTVDEGNFYDRAGVQRAANLHGTVYESQVANPYGFQFNESGDGVLFIDEIGYRQFSSPGKLNTWVRVDGAVNTSHYTAYKGGKSSGGGVFALADHQFTQPDPSKPRRGLYAGASWMWADPNIVAYSQYYEARIYDVGPFASRPNDQVAFVANMTGVSQGYRLQLREKGYGTSTQIVQLTASYTYHIAAGVFFTGGFIYAIHPSPYHDDAMGDPILFKGVLSVYF